MDVFGDDNQRWNGVLPVVPRRCRLGRPQLQDGIYGIGDLALDARGWVDVHDLEVADETA
jgi:hypothetical protein